MSNKTPLATFSERILPTKADRFRSRISTRITFVFLGTNLHRTMKPMQVSKLQFVPSVCRTECTWRQFCIATRTAACCRNDYACVGANVGAAVLDTSCSSCRSQLASVGPTSARKANAKLREVISTSVVSVPNTRRIEHFTFCGFERQAKLPFPSCGRCDRRAQATRR